MTTPGEGFDPNRPYTGCLICGRVFQDDDYLTRQVWSFKHAKTHKAKEHFELWMSGNWCTPEAAQVFAAFGIIALSDMVWSEEHKQALLESKPIIVKEVETK